MIRAALLIAALSLAGCSAAKVLAPQTTAGYEAGGIVGAAAGLSGAIFARCQHGDGKIVTLMGGALVGAVAPASLDAVEAARRELCRRIDGRLARD